jgi:protein-tyrosine-phosphatase
MTPPGGGRPQSVLFACTQNAIRSPMAEALARHFFGREIYIASAGVRPGPLDPFAIAVMDEEGMDISKHKPHSFDDLEDSNFDLIVTLSPEAHHKALEFTRMLASEVVYWPTLDPSATHGSRDQVLEAYRAVRDGLTRRIKERLEWRPMGAV